MIKKIEEANGIVSILNFLAFVVNLLVFIPLLKEQIKTGYGFGTHFEMLVLAFWMIQIITIPFILSGLIHSVYRIIIKKCNYVTCCNLGIAVVTIVMIALTVFFEFN